MGNNIIRFNPNLRRKRIDPEKYLSFKTNNPAYKARSECAFRDTDDVQEVVGKLEIGGVTINIHTAVVKKTGKSVLEWSL